MKATYLYAFMATGALLLAPACSDNLNADLEPVKTERVLDVTVDGQKLSRLDLKASPSETLVEVKSNTRWTVEISNCEGGWCSVDVINGTGDGSFSITTLDNMRDVRDCDVTVYMTDAEGQKDTKDSWTIKVQQEVSNVRLTPSSIEPFAAQNPRTQEFSIVSNVAWTLDVSYEGENPTEFVTVTPISGMEAGAGGTFSGSDAASFRISLQENRTAADRKAYLNLKSDVSTYTVEITQSKSEYTFDVTPSENRVVAAEGGTITFGVLSLTGWDAVTSADWITFSVASAAEGSASRVETVATVAPNSDGVERTASIQFRPRDDRYPQLTVSVTQRGYDAAFSVSRTDSVGVVPETGDMLRLELDSRFQWASEAPSWLSLDYPKGNASSGIQTIQVKVAPNATNDSRTGFIALTPLPTEFPGGVILDPSVFDLGQIVVGVTQFGGREPAISVPWLRDGYTQTSATVEFNYYSPYYAVTELGLEYSLEGATDIVTVKVTPKDSKEGTASFDLNDLKAASKYVARGYVKDEQGNVKYGDWSYPFTTAGQYPGSSDNPTPTR